LGGTGIAMSARLIWAALFALLALSAPAAAQNFPCPVPWTFTNGSGGTFQPDANQMNQNFAAVEACLLPATPNSLGIVQPDGLTITVNGQGVISAGLVGDTVLNNSDLMAAKTTSFPNGVWRLAYSGAPYAPTSTPVFYLPSTSTCVLGAGAGDGGSQVISGDKLCWLAQLPVAADIRWWGLTSNPVNFYVSPTGNDYGAPGSGANKCVVVANPCLTEAQIGFAITQFDVAGGNAKVNFLGTATWNQDFFANNQLRGAVNFGNNPVAQSPSQIILSGNGPSNTTLAGSGRVCATVAASYGAIIGVRQMTLTGNATGCQSSMFAQEGGIINVYDGVVLGAASEEQEHSEDPGSEIQNWNCPTFTGNANAGTSAGQSSWVIFSPLTACSIVISGALTYNTSFNYVDTNATTQYNPGASFNTSGGSVLAPSFIAETNGVLNNLSGATIPGNVGYELSGGRYTPALSPCISSTALCRVDSPAPTGLGSGYSVGLTSGSGPHDGIIMMVAGSGASNAGVIELAQPSRLLNSPAGIGPCIPTVQGGMWSTGATSQVDSTDAVANTVDFLWTNTPGNSLINGDTYFIPYHCGADHG
jgi:hypothetical protein